MYNLILAWKFKKCISENGYCFEFLLQLDFCYGFMVNKIYFSVKKKKKNIISQDIPVT